MTSWRDGHDRPGCVAGEVRRRTGEAPARRRQRAVRRTDRPSSPTTSTTRTRRSCPVNRCSTRSRWRSSAAGFAGLVTGARLKQAGIDDVRIIDKGGDVGGNWYWNRYPGRAVRHRRVHLPPAARRDRPHADREVHPRARDPRALPAHRQPLRPVRQRLPVHRGHRGRVGRGVAPLDHPHQPGRRDARQVPGDGHRPAAPPEAAGHPGHRDVRRPQLPHQPVGLRLHRRRRVRRADGRPRRQAGRDHRHRRHIGAVHPAPGPRRRRPVRVPAHAVVDRHPQQPPDRSRVVRHARTGLAGRVADELHHAADRRVRRRRPGDGRLDRHLAAHPRPGDRQRRLQRRRDAAPPTTTATTRRWRRSASASTRSSPTRTSPRRSSPGTASCASGRASTTSTCSRTTTRTSTSIDTDGKGVERIDETGVWVGGEHYELDLLIYASGFEVGTPLERRTGFDPVGRDGITLSEYWADGMRSLHGIHAHNFPNAFIVSPAQGANLISNVPHNLTESGSTIAAIIAHAEEIGAEEIEVTAQAGGRLGGDAARRRALVRRRPDVHARLLQQRGRRDLPGMRSASATPTARWRTSTTSRPGASPATSTASTSADQVRPGSASAPRTRVARSGAGEDGGAAFEERGHALAVIVALEARRHRRRVALHVLADRRGEALVDERLDQAEAVR